LPCSCPARCALRAICDVLPRHRPVPRVCRPIPARPLPSAIRYQLQRSKKVKNQFLTPKTTCLTDPLPCWRDGLRPVPNFRREAPSRGGGGFAARVGRHGGQPYNENERVCAETRDGRGSDAPGERARPRAHQHAPSRVEFENTCSRRPLGSHSCHEFLTDPIPSAPQESSCHEFLTDPLPARE